MSTSQSTSTGTESRFFGGIIFSNGAGGLANTAVFSSGSGQYLMLESNEELNNVDTFTVSFWVNIKNNNKNQYLISKWETSSGKTAVGKFAISYYGGDIYFYVVGKDGSYYLLKAEDSVELNKWHHIVASCGYGTMAIYVNNMKTAESGINSVELFSDESPVYIFTAKSSTDNPWQYYNLLGTMDNLRLYNKILDQNEIALLYSEFSITYDPPQ